MKPKLRAKTDERLLSVEFKRGYYMAVANLIRQHDQPVMARDVLSAYGNVSFKGIDRMDVATLKPIAAEIRRTEKLLKGGK